MATSIMNRLGDSVEMMRKRLSKLAAPQNEECPWTYVTPEQYAERVAQKAYELYERRGRADGRDQEDWFEAERLVKEELKKIF